MKVVMEVQLRAGRTWHEVAALGPDDPPGSLSDNGPDGKRDVYLFGWRDDQPGVWRSVLGLDVEHGVGRTVHSLDLDLIHNLADGEPFELYVQTDRSTGPRVVRFTLHP